MYQLAHGFIVVFIQCYVFLNSCLHTPHDSLSAFVKKIYLVKVGNYASYTHSSASSS